VMDVMFYEATAFNQNLCAWGARLDNSISYILADAFQYNSCPSNLQPTMSASPPGPFCHVCV